MSDLSMREIIAHLEHQLGAARAEHTKLVEAQPAMLAVIEAARKLVSAHRERRDKTQGHFRYGMNYAELVSLMKALAVFEGSRTAERDPSNCWRCGEPLHQGHLCAAPLSAAGA